MKRLKRWIRFFARKTALKHEVDSELAFHLETAIREKIARGMAPEAARRETLIEFGGREQWVEECHDAHRIASIENTLANLKSAARFLRKSPGFSITVVLTLALGIGANNAVFCAVDAILLRALPYPHSNELVEIHQFNRHSSNPMGLLAPARLKDWSGMNTTLQAISGYYTENVSETSGSLPEKLTSANVAPGFFEVMGVAPELGRGFLAAEYQFRGPDAVIISDRFWRERFHADPAVLGKKLHIEGRSFPIVGVMPRSFHFPNESVDLWQAVPLDAPIEQNRRFTWFTGIGRMKPGVTVDEVRANLDLVQARLARQFPDTDKDLTASVQRLKQVMIGTSGHSLWLLYGSVSLLLLIACANVAALLLSRIADRQREIAIRYSLGASRGAIVAQLLTETLLLGLLGSLAGLGVAALGLRIFHSLIQALPRAPEIGIEWQILLYTLISAFGATLLCGIVPALLASRRTISSTLAAGSRTQVSGNASLQWSLVGVQVALAVTLLIGAGLLIRSFRQLERVSLGFDASNVLTFQVSGNYGETGDQKALHARMMQTLDALSSIPGAESVALSDTLPGVGGYYPITVTLPDAVVDSGRQITADSKVVSSGYFRTLRIPVLAGQTCDDNVSWNGAVVNRSFARSYLAGQPVIDKHVQMTGVGTLNAPPALIVGIAGDAREDGAEEPPSPAIYWCSANSRPDPYFLIRTHGDPASYSNAVRVKIHQIQPARSVFNLATLQEAIYSSSAETRFRTLLLTLFGVTAIALAAIGLYGTLSYLIGLRQREIGLRMALGALPREIGLHYILRGLRVTLAGAITGLVVAVACSRVLSGMLYGVSRVDATTYIAVVAGALVLGAVASCLPARRAARLDPVQVLRYE